MDLEILNTNLETTLTEKMNSKQFDDYLKSIETPWGQIGYITFKRTYSRRLIEDDLNSKTEEFWQEIKREMNGIEKQLKLEFSQQEKLEYARTRLQLKWSVAGRFMWQLGTKTVDKLGLPSLQNCFSAETEFVTNDGIKKFSDFNDGDQVLIKGQNSWKEATVKNFGNQDLVELIVKRGTDIRKIKTTLNHRWKIANKYNKFQSIKTTEELSKGDILQKTSLKTNLHNLKLCKIGIQHGLVFGDGNYNENAKCCAFTPCGDSIEEYFKLFNEEPKTKEISGLPYNWKLLPSFDYNKHYIYGFLAGWFAADGSIGTSGTLTLSNKNKETLKYAQGLFAKLDIYCGKINLSRSLSPFDGSEAPLWRMTIHRDNLNSDFLLLQKHKKRWKNYSRENIWRVIDISDVKYNEPVWCIFEPENEEFTLSNGILTKNCAGTIVDHPVRPFVWAMELLMLGCGVGYNIQNKHVSKIPKVLNVKKKIERLDNKDADFIIPDTREGWVKLLGKVLKTYFLSGEGFTYSTQLIRGEGAPIKGFGGTASGPEILVNGINNIIKVLENKKGKQVRPIDCLDIMNIIGSIVVAGNVRRSAELAIGDYFDIEFLKAKRWDLGIIPDWRNMSNNSVAAPEDLKSLPNEYWETYQQGEPYGLINLDLARSCGRLGEIEYPDLDVEVFNPCVEQPLNNTESCCLSDLFLPNINSYEELLTCIGFAYRVCKHSLAIHCSLKETETIVHRNMRMGIGVTGYLQASEEKKNWLKTAYKWLREYDKEYSKKMGWPPSIKLTTFKPSGSLSLLAGVTPGLNPNPAGPYYIRRVRISSQSPLVEICKNHGYKIEYQKNFSGSIDPTTVVVEFIDKVPEETPVAGRFTWKEQIDTIIRGQSEWSDNGVSCTVTYNIEELPEIKEYLEKNFNSKIKAISFLLYSGHGFKQAPYEEISKEQYEEMIKNVVPINGINFNISDSDFEVMECIGGACPIK